MIDLIACVHSNPCAMPSHTHTHVALRYMVWKDWIVNSSSSPRTHLQAPSLDPGLIVRTMGGACVCSLQQGKSRFPKHWPATDFESSVLLASVDRFQPYIGVAAILAPDHWLLENQPTTPHYPVHRVVVGWRTPHLVSETSLTSSLRGYDTRHTLFSVTGNLMTKTVRGHFTVVPVASNTSTL